MAIPALSRTLPVLARDLAALVCVVGDRARHKDSDQRRRPMSLYARKTRQYLNTCIQRYGPISQHEQRGVLSGRNTTR